MYISLIINISISLMVSGVLPHMTDDCELCDDGDLNPDIVPKKTLVLGTCYEEYMEDVRKNVSNGKHECDTKSVMNDDEHKNDTNNNNGEKGKPFFLINIGNVTTPF